MRAGAGRGTAPPTLDELIVSAGGRSTAGILDERTGIATQLHEADAGRGDPSIHVLAASVADLTEYGYPAQASSNGSGAGLTRDAALGAAVGETMERYSLAIPEPPRLVLGSYDELSPTRRCVEPSSFALFDPAQAGTPFPRFTNDLVVSWVDGVDLTDGDDVLVPAYCAFLPHGVRSKLESVPGPGISTGGACGETASLATRGGLAELIERDAFMIVWRNRLSVPRVTWRADSRFGRLFEQRFHRPGLDYRVYLTTLDIDVPCFFGTVRDRRGAFPGVVVGGAAGLDPVAAVTKTLLELVQGLRWVDLRRSAPRTTHNADSYDDIESFTDHADLYAFDEPPSALDFLEASGEQVGLDDLTALATGDAPGDVAILCSLLDQRGVSAYVVDRTAEEVAACGYSVVKVVAPQLEVMEGDHRFPLLGGARWRDVPVRLGRRTDALDLHQVNPFPHPYP